MTYHAEVELLARDNKTEKVSVRFFVRLTDCVTITECFSYARSEAEKYIKNMEEITGEIWVAGRIQLSNYSLAESTKMFPPINNEKGE